MSTGGQRRCYVYDYLFDVCMFTIVIRLILIFRGGGRAAVIDKEKQKQEINIGRSRKMRGTCVGMIDDLDLRFVFVRPGALGQTLVLNLLPLMLPLWYK